MDSLDEPYLKIEHPVVSEEYADVDADIDGGPVIRPRPIPRRAPRRKKASPDAEAEAKRVMMQQAVTGAAAAGIITSALTSSSSGAQGCGKGALRSAIVACAALGLGALYAGMLILLYRRIASLQKSFQKTQAQVEMLSRLLESDQEIPDEPLPPQDQDQEDNAEEGLSEEDYHVRLTTTSTYSDMNMGIDDDMDDEGLEMPRVEELSSPPRPRPSPRKKPAAKPRKRASPKQKAVVFDLDAVAAAATT